MALFSKFQTLPVTCHEYVHPWTKSCSGATAGLGLTSVQESFRIYLTVYMVPGAAVRLFFFLPEKKKKMAVFSKFETIPASCRDYFHPYTESCSYSAMHLLFVASPRIFKMYMLLNLLGLLMRGKLPTRKDIKGTALRIIQSTSFLTCHAFSYSLFLCFLRKVLGNFNFLTVSFLPAFLASYFSILVERPSRRGLLCLYVTNVASETLFRMATWRGWVRPVRHGEVAIFTVSIAGLLYFYRGNHCSHDTMYGLLRFVVGPFEESGYMENREDLPSLPSQKTNTEKRRPRAIAQGGVTFRLISALCRLYRSLIKWVQCHNRHATCPHPFSCFYYTVQGTAKLFSIGYGLQICLRLLLKIKRIIRQPSTIINVITHREAFKFGAFLGGFSGIFRMTSCVLRWFFDRDSKFHALPGGLLAGLTFAFFPDNTIALYIMWKVLQVLYSDGVDRGFLPELPGATIFLYCLSTSILFHAALLEPHNLRPSYWKFLHRLSGGWIVSMNRKPLDSFGLESSKSLSRVLAETGTDSIPITHF